MSNPLHKTDYKELSKILLWTVWQLIHCIHHTTTFDRTREMSTLAIVLAFKKRSSHDPLLVSMAKVSDDELQNVVDSLESCVPFLGKRTRAGDANEN